MSNRLNKSLSPYLLQHAQNPVDWFPWSDEAFEKAKKENKPVLVSIGYSACHWCHVMEHESFEDESTATYMNEHFVNIKVDREEHPDVDHFYMDALQAMTGGGGWPLNMFVTPERKPFYGGTYFPVDSMSGRSSWMQVLQAIQAAWHEKADEIEQQSDQMIQHLKSAGLVNESDPKDFQKAEFEDLTQNVLKQADTAYGGFGAAPKFPSTMAIQYLLDFYHFHQDQTDGELAKEALAQAFLSLDKMIDGGIYDQLGGGFSRYSTDRKWLVPHFEKMLYDNALLISVLSNAYRITENEKYREVIEETIEFCLNELRSDKVEEEGFYCALDADSEGVEGKFYVWTLDQFQQALPDAHPALAAYYGISKEGNWEGVNILHRALHRKELLVHYSLPLQEWYHILDEGKQQLLKKRNERVRPGLDDKMLLSWNALMTTALCKAALALKNDRYLKIAGRQLDWLLSSFQHENGLMHAYKNKHAYIAANLDDYAFLIKALLDYASASGKMSYISLADQYMKQVIEEFTNAEHCYFNFSSKNKKDILVHKVDLYDGAVPSANSVLLECLYHLGNLKENRKYIDIADLMLHHIWPTLKQYPLSFAHWATLAQWKMQGIKQLVITGKDVGQALLQWQEHYFPQIFTIISDSSKEDLPVFKNITPAEKLKVYLCSQWECMQPVSSIDEILIEIKKSA